MANGRPAPPIGHAPYNVNGEGGRPMIYTDEFIEKFGEEMLAWFEADESHIMYTKFLVPKRIAKQRLSEFKKKNRRFSELLAICELIQENRIAEKALDKSFSDPMSRFMLTNHHGYKQAVETKISGSSKDPLHCIVERVSGETKDLVQEDDESEE
jgi:hypothetical protein